MIVPINTNIEIKVPSYTPGSYGPWTLAKGEDDTSALGYVTPYSPEPADLFQLSRDGDVWMSTCKLERESHMPHVADARGVVVVAGVGMGMYLRSIADKPEVTEIHAYDISPDVLNLLRQATDFEQWEGRSKFTLHCGDILDLPKRDFPKHVDYLYADIWLDLGCSRAMSDVRRMQHSVGATHVGWWGMELDYMEWQRFEKRDMDSESYAEWTKISRLPLADRDASDFVFMADTAVTFERVFGLDHPPQVSTAKI